MNCLICGKPLVRGQKKFCSQEHCNEYKKQEKIQNWLNGNDQGWTGTGIKDFIRNYLLEKQEYKCEICGWGKKNPYSGLIPLQIHHKDGNFKNNTISNLQVLCPNCHSLTDTYKSMNKDSVRDRSAYVGRKKEKYYCIECGVEVNKGSLRCRSCEAKRRTIKTEDMPITREELKDLIRIKPFTQIAKQFNVTDNAIRKWCDKFNLPRRVKDIKEYSNQEWEKL